MDFMANFVDIIIHLDRYLTVVMQHYGTWTYLILFLVIFCETGLVVTPFLPGDSLLFAAGALAALGALNPTNLVILLIIAAVAGDTVNYWVGNFIGPRAFSGQVRFLKQEYLTRTQQFYERHGGKTIVLARFVPIIRTFAPFVAGVGTMSYRRFFAYNVIGGVVWVVLFTLAGFFFGNIPVIKHNFSLVIVVIIAISLVPIAVEFLKARLAHSAGVS